MPVSKGPAGVKQEMDKFKAGELHSGSPTGPVVTNPKQAIAIALNEAGMSKEQKAQRGRSAHGSGAYSASELAQGHRKLGKC